MTNYNLEDVKKYPTLKLVNTLCCLLFSVEARTAQLYLKLNLFTSSFIDLKF